MTKRPISERMAEAKAALLERRRVPRCFYLNAADYAEFVAMKPPLVTVMFSLPLGHRPSPMECPSFDEIAVRESTRKPGKRGVTVSNLICCVGTSKQLRPQ